MLMPVQRVNQFFFHIRPFVVYDTKHGSIAYLAIITNTVFAQQTFVCGANSQYGIAATLVLLRRLKLHAVSAQFFETISEQQEFALPIVTRAPVIGVIPGPAYFELFVVRVDVVKHGAANQGAANPVYYRKRILFASTTPEDGAFQKEFQAFCLCAVYTHVFPNARDFGYLHQIIYVVVIKRREQNTLTFKINRMR